MKEKLENIEEYVVWIIMATGEKVVDMLKRIWQLFRYYKYQIKELVRFPRKIKFPVKTDEEVEATLKEINERKRFLTWSMDELMLRKIDHHPKQKKFIKRICRVTEDVVDGRMYVSDGTTKVNKILDQWDRAIDKMYEEEAA